MKTLFPTSPASDDWFMGNAEATVTGLQRPLQAGLPGDVQ